ncbi:MAG TPA: beta-ketoacyl-[acyl-carrier-protein] synthase family protein [Thiobacillus sp.]|nr:MAG: beta-ketoacyl-[acyl-carrier-protein] synthase II [Hydrogenophilales bacterium 28-61-11]OYZ57568.1 MAG: beta-ketoacyl-[acyl-carrier-protein] synthase II [Hydrogenophilales bacterium 16-61-112]OZA50078.1 MAG: beta-ketoacyl-[acyl-carrier-protein] synthase II [Hydrogenophilales bacterium 17-61-76]HQT30276.1 beta-ketoacyl-[acyl-carrier-protein] synthase family protein [Thiobacillus sp.]HQT69766.1 beta-ketoacyl-[acyl-carrier-protein] synthase family protein [Thiobacillus sp.]
MTPVQLSHFTATSCLGYGNAATLAALRALRSGLQPCQFETVHDLATYVGEVGGVDAVELPAQLAAYNCRNNRLAWLGLQQDGFFDAVKAAIARHGRRRVGVFLGTSTSGILETEQAFRHRDPLTGALPDDFVYRTTHNTYAVADFVRTAFQFEGPAVVVSTACSSSAKVFASAARMLAAGLIDAAIVGGVDSLCLTTLYGFNSLELLSPEPCRPYDIHRQGLSIGEAAAFILLERPATQLPADAVLLLGAGETSDAHHMSSPHPEGLGARMAMAAALQAAGLQAADIDYLNLHGTATPSNDAAEGRAVAALFGDRVPCSSTKGATGHTLGAAGGMEAIISALALQHGFLPGGVGTHAVDPAIPVQYLTANRDSAPQRVLSNSFGFGGTNCSLILGRAA